MEKHMELDDQEFEAKFAACALDPALFTHEAHLRLAWVHITKYGVNKAVTNITAQLRAFVKSVGAEHKYNETVTVAAIRAVYHFMLRSRTQNFRNFIGENIRLKNNFRALLGAHYRTDIFQSEKARQAYLEPELLPFD
jgi:hypothetical protein